jgi:hypothetical protein
MKCLACSFVFNNVNNINERTNAQATADRLPRGTSDAIRGGQESHCNGLLNPDLEEKRISLRAGKNLSNRAFILSATFQ